MPVDRRLTRFSAMERRDATEAVSMVARRHHAVLASVRQRPRTPSRAQRIWAGHYESDSGSDESDVNHALRASAVTWAASIAAHWDRNVGNRDLHERAPRPSSFSPLRPERPLGSSDVATAIDTEPQVPPVAASSDANTAVCEDSRTLGIAALPVQSNASSIPLISTRTQPAQATSCSISHPTENHAGNDAQASINIVVGHAAESAANIARPLPMGPFASLSRTFGSRRH